MKHKETAKRLQQALYANNMKAQELSDRSGVAKASISQYINGSHKPSNMSAGKMASILNVDPLWLMGFDVPMKRVSPDPTPIYEVAAGSGRICSTPSGTMNIQLRDDQFLATVKGRSMEPTLFDGDTVVIDRQSVPDQDGQIVMVKVDGEENTLKRVQIGENGITLIADNPSVYPTKFYTAEQVKDLPVQIMGVVTKLIRDI